MKLFLTIFCVVALLSYQNVHGKSVKHTRLSPVVVPNNFAEVIDFDPDIIDGDGNGENNDYGYGESSLAKQLASEEEEAEEQAEAVEKAMAAEAAAEAREEAAAEAEAEAAERAAAKAAAEAETKAAASKGDTSTGDKSGTMVIIDGQRFVPTNVSCKNAEISYQNGTMIVNANNIVIFNNAIYELTNNGSCLVTANATQAVQLKTPPLAVINTIGNTSAVIASLQVESAEKTATGAVNTAGNIVGSTTNTAQQIVNGVAQDGSLVDISSMLHNVMH